MKKNRIISIVVIALFAVMSLTSCKGVKNLRNVDITSASITDITPNGLRGILLDCAVGIDNPGIQISLSEISCDLKHSGKILGKVAIDPFTMKARTEEIYQLKADAQLGKDMTVLELGKFLNKDFVDQITVDIHARGRLKGGLAKRVTLTDVPLKKLIEFVK